MDKFLHSKEVAEMLGTTTGIATSTLAQYGVHPIDLGFGRSRGRRWLQSAVLAVMHQMHEEAQPKPKKAPAKPSMLKTHLTDMSVAEIFALTQGQNVQ